jgi:hypothetical protein
MVLYHLTSEDRLGRILQEGLKPRGKGIRRTFSEPSESTGGKIFLGRSDEEAYHQVGIERDTHLSPLRKSFALLEVHLPESYPLLEDESGYLYTTLWIPPECLQLLYTETDLIRQVKEGKKRWE